MNAFTFGDQAFLARAGRDPNPSLPLNYSGLWRWYRADSYLGAADFSSIGGGISTLVPWRDESGQFIDPGVTTATQALTVVNISGGVFVFTAAHVGQTIRYNSGGAAINSLIKTRNSATQVIVDTSQSVSATTFKLCDDASKVTGGPNYRTNQVGTMPLITLGSGYLNFFPGALANFTVMSVNIKTANNSFIVADSFVANHQLRRDFGGDKTTLFYAGTGVAASAFAAPDVLTLTTCRRTGAAVTFRENKTARGGGNDAGAWSPLEIGSATYGGNLNLGELLIYRGTVLSDGQVDFLYDNYFKPRWTTLP